MVAGFDVEDAVVTTLQTWLPAYVCEAERDHGWPVGSTPPIRGWAITGRDLQKLNSDQLPCIVVMAGGIVTPPIKRGPPGLLIATWGVEIGVVFSAAWGRASRRHAQLYAVATRTLMLQRPLDGLAAEVDTRGEMYDEMDFSDSRTYSAAVCSFNVTIEGVGWSDGGPPVPATAPGDPTVPFDPWVTVVEVDVAVQNVPPPTELPPD